MALINCRECKKEISDTAKQCPHCGCQTRFGNEAAQVRGMQIALTIACVAGLIGMFLIFCNIGPLLEGIDNYGEFSRWLSKNDDAWGIFLKVCIGLGMVVGAVCILIKIKREANWIKELTGRQYLEVPVRNYSSARISDELIDGRNEKQPTYIKRDKGVATNGWQCTCGRTNANYVTSCVCGKNKGSV